jgi:hypothetical protein
MEVAGLPQATVDFAAAGRVAKRSELKSIHLAEVSAKRDPKISAPLEPTVDVKCEIASHEGSALEILATCKFTARTTEAQVAEATVKYLLTYEIQGSEPLALGDLAEFAASNGTLNSWPFLREFLYGLTTDMGYAAYTLPTFHFVPKPPEKKDAAEKPKSETEDAKPHAKA